MMKTYDDLIELLKNNSDEKYKKFISKLIPNINVKNIIGLRMGDLRKIAKNILQNKDTKIFDKAKFFYREEKLLYCLCLFKMNLSLEETFIKIDQFLPHLDNWEVTDLLASELKYNSCDEKILFEKIKTYLFSENEFTQRLALVIMLKKFNKITYINEILCAVKNFDARAYYSKIAAAWLLCELYFTDKLRVNEFLSCDEIDVEIKKMTQRKIRESMKK